MMLAIVLSNGHAIWFSSCLLSLSLWAYFGVSFYVGLWGNYGKMKGLVIVEIL